MSSANTEFGHNKGDGMADVPKMFHLGNLALTVAPSLAFVTPLGQWVLGLEVGGVSIPPAAVYAVGVRSVAVWLAPMRFEVLLTPAPISLPPGMAVSGTSAAVWRMDATLNVRSPILTCLCATGASWSAVGPETGENLDAQTWTDGRTKVTIGLPEYEAATTYRRDGFEIILGAVGAGQGHFVCAWGPDVPDDISTWFAVDWPTSRLVPTEAEPAAAPPPPALPQ